LGTEIVKEDGGWEIALRKKRQLIETTAKVAVE
jgi:hypothetical protein